MQFSIDILQKEREKIISDLKLGKQERLMDLQDIEEDNRNAWVEYEKADGKHYLLYGDDILLITKPR